MILYFLFNKFDKKYIERTIEWIESEKEYMASELKTIDFIDFVYPSECNFVLCRLKNIHCNKLYDMCLKRDVLIRRADNFKGLDSSFARFAIKDRESNEKFLKILRESGDGL